MDLRTTAQPRPAKLVPVAALTLALGLLAAPSSVLSATAQAAVGGKASLQITLATKPSPPKMGPNSVEVVVKTADGKPLTDGELTAVFFMAAMPAMKMPEMKSSIALTHQKDGRYSGSGHVAMAGKWDVIITVKRAGKEIGSQRFPVTAQ